MTDESMSNDAVADESAKSVAERVKSVAESGGIDLSETMITVSAAEVLDLVQKLDSANAKITWLERKKRTIADLARAAHNWSKVSIELSEKRLLHVEEVLDAAQGFYDELSDGTEFKKGYGSALDWFKTEILDDAHFTVDKKASDDAKD